MASNTLHYWLIFLSFKGNIIWTCSVRPVSSLSVAKDFCQFFSQLLRILFSLNLKNKKWGSPCSFQRKTSIYLAIELSLREISYAVYFHAFIDARHWPAFNVRDFCQAKLDSEINAHFLLKEHDDPHFLFYTFNENNILNNWEKNWQKSMATFLANVMNAIDRDVTVPTEQVQIMFPLKDKNVN